MPSVSRHLPLTKRGFTLVELVVSLAITAVLMLAMGSAMLFAARAMPDAGSPALAMVDTGRALEQIITELQYAVSIKSWSATMIEFTVADRDGNDIPETVRYEWSGTPGDALTRQYNGGSMVGVLDRVEQFDLTYDTETISSGMTPENESAETLLCEYNSLDNFGNPEIAANLWSGQYIVPSLPADTIRWKVTRIAFYAAGNGKNDGAVSVEMQLPTGAGVPGGTVLEAHTLLESTLTGNFSTVEYDLSGVSGLSPDRGICLVFRYVAGTKIACILQGQNQNNTPEYGNLVESTDQGASWSGYTNRTLLYAIYGTVTTPGEPQIEETHYVRAVGMKLRTGTDTQATLQSAVRLLNKPELMQ